jgi:tetratricopeptide (TPR) repeat protein
MRWAALLLLVTAARADAGLYYSGEAFRPLPARWSGYLPDLRLLRVVGMTDPRGLMPSPPLRDAYADAALKLEAAAKAGELTADEAADLGALDLRLGRPAKALAVLRGAARKHPEHFRLAANLGTAWQLNGDLPQAVSALEEAVRLAPPELKAAEQLHLKLARSRAAAPKSTALDDLFDYAKLPPDALALAQRLALSLPNDGRLVWQLGELAHATGDTRTAAALLDGCVGEFALADPEVRRRRELYRAQADALERAGKHATVGTTEFRSRRALVRAIDPSRLPTLRPDGVNPIVWAAVGETEYGRDAKPVFLKYLDALDGKRVSVTGFMAPGPGGRGTDTLTGFVLTENPVGCWFCETPGPTQVLMVELAPGQTAEPTRNVVKVAGTLRLNRTDPEQYPFTITNARLAVAD